MATRTLALSVLGALLLAPLAVAQGHEHGAAGPTVLAHDGPMDGRQFVGNLAHFVAIAHGDDAIPDFHQDVPVRVTLNGRVLFETTPDSGHDYDGVNAFDVVFPEPGPYRVEALVDGKVADALEGIVLPEATMQVGLHAEDATEVAAGTAVTYMFDVQHDGVRVDHSDCWVELARDGATLLRTKTHTHKDAQQVTFTFPEAGTYGLRRTCFQAYPSANVTLFVPVVDERLIQVSTGIPLPGMAVNDGQAGMPPTAQNAVVQGRTGGELLLVGTFDPYTIVGTNTLQHLAVLALDPATGIPRQHVDFEASLAGPAGGLLFSSDTLHEYDGVYELATRQAVPGLYTLTVSADAGDWRDTILMQWAVAPPAAPTSAGQVSYALDKTEHAGDGSDYVLAATAAAGPFAHSEAELRVLPYGHEPAVPVLVAKLHTHDDGSFPFHLALPEGQYVFAFDGFPLLPEAVLVQPASFEVPVPAGQVAAPLAADDGSPQDAPAPAFVLALLALLAMARRR